MNAELAHATVCQSRFSLEAHRRLGIDLVDPTVIPNAPDPEIFHPPADTVPIGDRRIRVVAASWSDNPRKGVDALRALGRADPARFELTFVGRAPAGLEGWNLAPPLASRRSRRSYASRTATSPRASTTRARTPCSRRSRAGSRLSTVEAAVIASSRGTEASGFDGPDDVAAALERLARELDERRAAIGCPPLSEVADRYAEVLARVTSTVRRLTAPPAKAARRGGVRTPDARLADGRRGSSCSTRAPRGRSLDDEAHLRGNGRSPRDPGRPVLRGRASRVVRSSSTRATSRRSSAVGSPRPTGSASRGSTAVPGRRLTRSSTARGRCSAPIRVASRASRSRTREMEDLVHRRRSPGARSSSGSRSASTSSASPSATTRPERRSARRRLGLRAGCIRRGLVPEGRRRLG